jgi:tagatose 6-phosphate kinase
MRTTLCVGLTPALQELREFARFRLGEVNRAAAILRSAAGKGVNVARVLRQLGGRPLLLGFAGGDTGRFVRACLRRARVAERLTPTRAATRVCTTILDRATGTATELVEEAALPTEREWRLFFAAVERARRQAHRMVIAGALMPGARPDVYRRLAETGLPLIIDAQMEPLLLALLSRPLVAKLNVQEMENTLRHRCAEPRAILAGARELLARGARHVVVTDGPKGAWLVGPEGAWHCRPPRVAAVNPVGSGDAMTAGICRGLDQRRPLPEAVRLGLACGAANALTRAAGDVVPADVRRIEPLVRVRRVR